ncbi:MAG: endonuclease III, partial [Phascolarctobacterium sp.]|nr:endonuclease III [Phascolarctobacterium sp.]
EKELQKAIPKEKWSDAHHWFIWHGRLVCKARKPLCSECVLLQECPYKEKNI